MSGQTKNLLKAIEVGTREEIWEAAKRLSSAETETNLSLLSLLTTGKKPDTRAAAAYVLGLSRNGAARCSLENVLSNRDEDPAVRGHAAEALGYIQNRDSVNVLIQNLSEKNAGVKYWCIFALGQIGDPESIPMLRREAESSNNEFYETRSLQAEALDAIAEIERRKA